MKVKIAITESELLKVVEVLKQLRDQFSGIALYEQVLEQQKHGYKLAYVELENNVICVAGFVITSKLATGKHLYVDDLVTDQSHRSLGAGKAMIDWLKCYSQHQGCEELHLDSGVHRKDAHRFYLREGFEISSHHFTLRN